MNIIKRAWLFSAAVLLSSGSAMAGLCGSGPDQKIPDERIREERFARTLFPEVNYHGIEAYNRILIECNRKRDSRGGDLRRELGKFGEPGFSSELTRPDLDWKMITGHYNFQGTQLFAQKYVYLLGKKAGNWEMILPYNAEIHDVVKGRVDFFMGYRDVLDGKTGKIGPSNRTGPAWSLYEASQVAPATDGSGTSVLKPGAQPIAQTRCSSSTFSSPKNRYDGQNGFYSNKRDHENRHIDLGLIQYRYDKHDYKDKDKVKVYEPVKEGCRVKDNEFLYWVTPEALTAAASGGAKVTVRVNPKAWIFDNFIRVGQEFWSRPANFTLRIWLRGHNDSDFTADERSRIQQTDHLTVRFATKFMAYGGNQMYKSNPIQFNNFSTMTTDGTHMHEVGHALGLDDEYSSSKNGDCQSDAYAKLKQTRGGKDVFTKDYQMCSGYDDAVVTTVYHYIAVSRYAATQRECKDDSNCGKGEWCNAGIDTKRNQCTPKAADGDSCPLVGGDHACESGSCKNGRCFTPNSMAIGEACFVNDACRTGNCNNPVGGGAGTCVCKVDRDCGDNGVCKQGTLGLQVNQCVITQAPVCKAGWHYEIRDPLNKDRCNRTTTQSARLECKLAVTDIKDNWTGPHATKGPDVCRSTKGKDPKDVRCPGGFQYTVKDGADTCTKSNVEHETPTCPPKWNYNSMAGKDRCEPPR